MTMSQHFYTSMCPKTSFHNLSRDWYLVKLNIRHFKCKLIWPDTDNSYICAHISRSLRPLLVPPRLRADAAATGCASECPAPASAALSSSAASGSPPGAAGPAAGSAGPSCGPCPCSSSRRCCSSLVAGDTLHCPCWCFFCSPEHAELAGGRKRSPTNRKLV